MSESTSSGNAMNDDTTNPNPNPTNNPTNNLFARTKSSFNKSLQSAKTTIQTSTNDLTNEIKSASANASGGKGLSLPKVSMPSVNLSGANKLVGNIGSMFPTPRYALPDKTVASQVLMYRQLLHTECKPGLRLSRAFQGTEAQRSVMHMPWWEAGVETTKRMVISYDNLIVRLWLNGAIMPYVEGGYAEEHKLNTAPKDDDDEEEEVDLLNMEDTTADAKPPAESTTSASSKLDEVGEDGSHIDTLIDEKGLPPVPHRYWIDRLGFQQNDPVTDFRSGGVLSLAMLVHIVEACPDVHARFLPSGDAHMLPFGITCINVTDMIAKFCMFAKSVDRMDALLSQKPFWKMFGDPNALLVLQELSMDMLCDVVVELKRERKIPKVDEDDKDGFQGQDGQTEVTVFDFAEILSRTETRVKDDLLGGGPRSVDDLRSIHSKICSKYLKAIKKKEVNAQKKVERVTTVAAIRKMNSEEKKEQNEQNFMHPTMAMTDNMIDKAGDVFNNFKTFGFSRPNTATSNNKTTAAEPSSPATATEEINFALPQQGVQGEESAIKAPTQTQDKPNLITSKSEEAFDFIGKDEVSKLGSTTNDSDEPPAFTIDDDDFL